MFCQQCGAEAPTRALTCPTCGHDLGRSAADLRSNMTLPEFLSSSPGISNLSLPFAISPLSATIQPGDLDRPGWPRDALGRLLLLIVLTLAVDLFLLPWRLVGSQHETLPAPAGMAIAVLVLLAAVPLFHPALRRRPMWAILPVLVGGVCLGIGVAFWVNPTPPTIFVSGLTGRFPTGDDIISGGAIPDVGLFGFLIGALILVGVGYQIFLAAARNSGVVPVVTAAAAAHPRTVPVSPVAVPQTEIQWVMACRCCRRGDWGTASKRVRRSPCLPRSLFPAVKHGVVRWIPPFFSVPRAVCCAGQTGKVTRQAAPRRRKALETGGALLEDRSTLRRRCRAHLN